VGDAAAQLAGQQSVAAAHVERAATAGRNRTENEGVVVDVVVPAIP
jgi:hypothetical protein